MSRKTAALKPQLNRIRAWAQEGSTDAWIAHQLDTTAEIIAEFRAEQAIGKSGPAPVLPITPDAIVEAMRAEEEAGTAPPKRRRTPAAAVDTPSERADENADEEPPASASKRRRRTKADAAPHESTDAPEAAGDAKAAEAVTEPTADGSEDGEPAPRPRRRRRSAAERAAETEAETETGDEAELPRPAAETADAPEISRDEHEPVDEADSAPSTSTRRRRRRGGRGRGSGNGAGGGGELRAQAVPGRVIVLGDAITSNATFREHWSDTSAFTVEVSADAITLRRS